MFVKARQRSIVDVPAQRITLTRLERLETIGDVTVEDIQARAIEDILQRPVDPCHIEYLTAMGVQSSLVMPILHHQNLWGLLVSHHSEPKAFSEEALQLVQSVTDQVSIAIAQSDLLTQTREKARREAFLNQISTLLHSSLNIQQILRIVLEAVVKAVRGSSGRLYLTPTNTNHSAQLYRYGVQPTLSGKSQPVLLENYPFWQQLLIPEGEGQQGEYFSNSELETTNHQRPTIKVITDIYQEEQLLTIADGFRPTPIRSLLAMPLQYGKQSLGCLSIFRNEVNTDIIWAGRFDPDERNNRVRDSFEAWRELKLGQACEWATEEVELVRSLGTHLMLAVMQNRLYQYEHEQRLLVEMRNQELNVARTVAEEASRLKSDFLSSTSHELRTPLASTLNYLKLLKEGFYDNEEELKEYIDVAYQSAENLVAIINDVLDIAKIEAGRMTINWETVMLRSLLEEQRKLFHLDSRRQGIDLIIECEVPSIYADKTKLRQILTNLLSNAFKFTDKGQVCVRAIQRSDQPSVEISVSDTGIGIDSSKGDILFEPFVQADGSVKRRYGGTGLGLAICKRLVELMGGQIWLDSQGMGQGTTVAFTLPNETNY
jgi:signal transduction histidine kinase